MPNNGNRSALEETTSSKRPNIDATTQHDKREHATAKQDTHKHNKAQRDPQNHEPPKYVTAIPGKNHHQPGAEGTESTPGADGGRSPTPRGGQSKDDDRLNALWRVSRECSRAILRSYNEDVILNETCRMLVEDTGYRMAWIAYTNSDNDLYPVAQAGAPPDFHPPEMNGHSKDLLQKTLLHERPEVTKDIPVTGNGVMKDHSYRYDYASQCSIPLRISGRTGALTVYAREKGAFSPQEVHLLRELADDLEQGIAHLQETKNNELLHQRLDEVDRLYATFFEDAQEGIFIATLGGTLKLVNRSFARILGYDEPKAVLHDPSTSLYTIMSPRDKNRLMENARSDIHPPLEMELQRADSTTAWVHLTAHPVTIGEGQWIKGIVHDLSPLREGFKTIQRPHRSPR